MSTNSPEAQPTAAPEPELDAPEPELDASDPQLEDHEPELEDEAEAAATREAGFKFALTLIGFVGFIVGLYILFAILES